MNQQPDKNIGLERIIFFSDAVIAIAITILVLEIRLPDDIHDVSDVFPGMLPKILAYIFSFLQIAVFWAAHHNLFKRLVGYDNTVIWLNFLFLMVIAFLPVPVATMIKLGISSGSITFIYSCLALLGIVEWGIWRYISDPKRNLIDSSVSGLIRKMEERKIMFVVVLFFAGILIAYLNAYVSVLIGFAIPLIHKKIDERVLTNE